MSTIIHFYSGKTIELDESEGAAFWKRAVGTGVRFWKSRKQNVAIMFNSPTIEYIELGAKDTRTAGDFEAEKRAVEEAARNKREKRGELTEEDEARIKEAALKKMETDFMARSNCRHVDEEGNTLRSMYFTDTQQGKRYFPVCDFCGHRERYVGIEKVKEGKTQWTEEDLENAKPFEG
jgi:hypothetical protein